MTLHHLALYSKAGCHMCQVARNLLLGMQHEFSFTLEEIDITGNPALMEQYRERIPVLVIDGRVTLSAPIRTGDVQAALTNCLKDHAG